MTQDLLTQHFFFIDAFPCLRNLSWYLSMTVSLNVMPTKLIADILENRNWSSILNGDIRVSTQAFWFPPLSFSAQAKLLQAPSGHACKGC